MQRSVRLSPRLQPRRKPVSKWIWAAIVLTPIVAVAVWSSVTR